MFITNIFDEDIVPKLSEHEDPNKKDKIMGQIYMKLTSYFRTVWLYQAKIISTRTNNKYKDIIKR